MKAYNWIVYTFFFSSEPAVEAAKPKDDTTSPPEAKEDTPAAKDDTSSPPESKEAPVSNADASGALSPRQLAPKPEGSLTPVDSPRQPSKTPEPGAATASTIVVAPSPEPVDTTKSGEPSECCPRNMQVRRVGMELLYQFDDSHCMSGICRDIRESYVEI